MIEFILLAVITGFAWYWLGRRKPRLSHLPGPRGWPIVGNILQLDRHFPHLTVAEWAKQYGEVFALRFINENWVFVNSYKSIVEILVKKGNDFAGRNISYRVSALSENGRGLVFGTPSEGWKSMKRATLTGVKFYTNESRSRMESILSELVDDFLIRMEKHRGESVDVRDDLYNFAIKSILTIVIGERIEDGNRFFALVQEMDHVTAESLNFGGTGSELDLLPWLRFFGNATQTKLEKSAQLLNDFWNRVSPNLKEKFDKSERSCVVHNMMEALNMQGYDATSSILELKIATRDLVAAGSVTTATSMYALLNILLHYPMVKGKLQTEIDTEIGQSRTIRLEDREQLPYMQATILEMQRYTTIVPLGIPHVSLSESPINGYKIPFGTNIVVNHWYLHHDESFWKDPWNFRPERFFDDKGRLVPPDHDNRKHLMPFGAGIRVCPGEALASARIFLLMSSILQRFDISPADGNALVPCDPRSYELGVVLYPKPFKLKMMTRL